MCIYRKGDLIFDLYDLCVLLFSYRKGDLIILEQKQTGEDVMTNGWCYGENARTKDRGNVSAEHVYILPGMYECNEYPDDGQTML